MNSTMIAEAYTKYLTALDKPTKAELLRQATCYYKASTEGDPQKLRSAYHSLLKTVQAGEQTTGIQLITSPDESFLCALNAVASKTYALVNKEYSVSFDSLQQANDWLADKRNLILTSVRIQTKTTLGMFANHSKAAKIIITFRVETEGKFYRYGICQQEKTQLFTRSKEDNGFVKTWEAANPGLECVFLQHTSNARASSGSMAFGFGLDYVEHVKYFITYRKPLAA